MRRLAIVVLLGACGQAPAVEKPEYTDDLDTRSTAVSPELRPEEAPPRIVPEARSPRIARARRARRARQPRRMWRGRRIDLDVRNADLNNLYRFLAEVGGINIVIAPDVRGSITLRLKAVPWDQIAYVVARVNNLEIERDGRLWLIRKRAN